MSTAGAAGWGLVLWMSLGQALAQERNSSQDLVGTVDARGAEWSALATNLEQKVARMLPCDARVRTSIEEVMRASDARFAALAALWNDVARRSREQTEIANKMAAESDADVAAWKTDQADAEQEQKQVDSKRADLRASAAQLPALGSASNALDGIAKTVAGSVEQSIEREDAAAQWKAAANDFTTASGTRQRAIESELKAIATESAWWNAYYAARIARAQMECALTGSAEGTASPATKKGTKSK